VKVVATSMRLRAGVEPRAIEWYWWQPWRVFQRLPVHIDALQQVLFVSEAFATYDLHHVFLLLQITIADIRMHLLLISVFVYSVNRGLFWHCCTTYRRENLLNELISVCFEAARPVPTHALILVWWRLPPRV